MLVVDDSRLNLLKMKEKLLELSDNRSENILNDYKDLVISIDKDEYESLINKIKENNYRDLPLEEQVSFLNEIESDYNSLNELQYGYKNIYSKYSKEELKLSDISNILIDNIISKASTIQGYLMNCKNLANNKIELEKLNLDLISALKKQDLINNKVAEVNKVIKNNLLNSEGRILDSHGNMIYTSIQEEFKNVDLNLKELIENYDLLQRELNNAEKEKKDNDEMLEAALICFKRDNSNEEVYNKIKYNAQISDYKLVLLEMINQICTETYDYDLMVNKLYRILNLIEERKIYLKNNFYIDPFERLKINEQLEFLNTIGDNSSEINKIRKTITYLTNLIDEMEKMNIEYTNNINSNIPILKGENSNSYDKKVIEENDIEYVDAFNNINNDNKVIRINDLNREFMLERVHEKTNGVINRVNELFNHNNSTSNIKIPDLIIDDISKNNINNTKEKPSFNDLNNNENTTDNKNIDVALKIEDNNINESNSKDNVVLFKETIPFDDTPLFYDRVDNDVFKNEKNDNNYETIKKIDKIDTTEEIMPEAFWTTINNNSVNEIEKEEKGETVSFDDQIKSLLNNDLNAKIKVR